MSETVIKPYYQTKMQRAVKILQDEMQGVPMRIHAPEGALFLWLWFEGMPISSEALYQRLKAIGVYVIAGQHFFPGLEEADAGKDSSNVDGGWRHQHECIRVSYSGAEEVVEKGLRLIAQTVREVFSSPA